MIEIDEILEKGYPRIDFKFLNKGSASSILYKVALSVEEIKLDTTPILNIDYSGSDDKFNILISNNGWGPAVDCKINNLELFPYNLFHNYSKQVCETIDSNKNISLTTVCFNEISKEDIERIQDNINTRKIFLSGIVKRMGAGDITILSGPEFINNLCSYEKWHLTEYFNDLKNGMEPSSPRQKWHIKYFSEIKYHAVPVNDIHIELSYKDIHGKNIIFKNSYNSGVSSLKQLWIEPNRFSSEYYSHPAYNILTPSFISVMLLEGVKGEKEYPVSLEIPEGRAERFQVMIAAKKSYNAVVKLKFYFDDKTVESNTFKINIFHPLNSRDHRLDFIKDGTAFIRQNDKWVLENSLSE